MGHFSKVCRYRNADRNSVRPKFNKAHCVTEQAVDNSSDSDYAFRISEGRNHDSSPTVKIKLNGIKGKADVDSCSTANVMDEDHLAIVQKAVHAIGGKIELREPQTKLFPYASNKHIPLTGRF